jgi:diacylglycerol O-acyltransferase / wax synthase
MLTSIVPTIDLYFVRNKPPSVRPEPVEGLTEAHVGFDRLSPNEVFDPGEALMPKRVPASAVNQHPAASAARGERMSRVDTAWLRMDSDVNLMMIVGVWLLEPGIKIADLRERVQSKLLQYRRFGQKVVEDDSGAMWMDADDFDIERHVRPYELQRVSGRSDRQALQDLVGDLATTPLDRAHPLWQFHLIENFDGDGGEKSALIARVHHCIADGIALISVMLSITDGGQDPPPRKTKAPRDEGGDWWNDALLKPLTDMAVKAIGASSKIYSGGVAKSMDMLAHPKQPLNESIDMARAGMQVVSDLAAFAMMPDDSPTRLKGKPAGLKAVAWGEPIPLEVVKAIGKGLGCSINDVLLSCAAGAIGAYLKDQGDDPMGKAIRAMVPVNLRPLEKAYQLGNRFGLVPLVLPIGLDNPVERLYAVRARMQELKGSFQPVLAFAMLSVAGLFIKPVQDALLGLFAKKATAVITNVPGPAKALTFCGSTLKQTLFWVPQSGDIGVGVSILSYAGGVQFGLITDRALCPDPQQIIDHFEPEFQKLLVLALMLPWGGD